MIFLYKGTKNKPKYGPMIGLQKVHTFPGKLLWNLFLIWRWDKQRYAIGFNRLKRIKKGEIYKYEGQTYNYKTKKYL
jgi:hypothetical protein